MDVLAPERLLLALLDDPEKSRYLRDTLLLLYLYTMLTSSSSMHWKRGSSAAGN